VRLSSRCCGALLSQLVTPLPATAACNAICCRLFSGGDGVTTVQQRSPPPTPFARHAARRFCLLMMPDMPSESRAAPTPVVTCHVFQGSHSGRSPAHLRRKRYHRFQRRIIVPRHRPLYVTLLPFTYLFAAGYQKMAPATGSERPRLASFRASRCHCCRFFFFLFAAAFDPPADTPATAIRLLRCFRAFSWSAMPRRWIWLYMPVACLLTLGKSSYWRYACRYIRALCSSLE